MAKKLALIFGLLILTVLGFALVYRSYPTVIPLGPAPKRPVPTVVNAPAPAIPSKIFVSMSEQNDSGIGGEATITEVEGKAVVNLILVVYPTGLSQPAHIHLGSCSDLGAVKYPLSAPVDGLSETNLGISVEELFSGLPLAINVHKSAAEAGTYVSCGDIPVQ
jgi:hypothetical protein